MNHYRLKACRRCGGDLVRDETDWICLQCGSYCYVGLYSEPVKPLAMFLDSPATYELPGEPTGLCPEWVAGHDNLGKTVAPAGLRRSGSAPAGGSLRFPVGLP